MNARRLLAASLLLGVVTTASAPAKAFCGFYVGGADTKLYNNATQVVLMREGTRTVLSMQNNYQGPSSNFAMVVPVPVILQKENVKTLPREVFSKVDQLDAPRLVEYWEQDPCQPDHNLRARSLPAPAKAAARGASGEKEKKDLGVTVEAQFTVGEYEVVILSAKDAGGLDTWLRREKYSIPEGAEPLFRPYIQAGSKFFVARVDASKVSFEGGMATLSPLRFHYDTEQFSLPVRLGLVNSSGTQDLIVHILARSQRYEVANYPNATIPTNVDVSENARDRFGSFYAALFDRTLEKNPKAVITEYSWDASTCDPCPGPALSYADFATLGADALPGQASPGGTMAPSPRGRGVRFSGGAGFVITRLHARYSKEALGDDLVFKAAPPITGGREVRRPVPPPSDPKAPLEAGELEHGAAPGSFNNFQGRYAIRHPWGGPVACENPRRGIWGGPPGHGSDPRGPAPAPKPAKDLAFVPRTDKLATFVRNAIPELEVKGEGPPVSAAVGAAAASAAAASAAATTSMPSASSSPADAGAGLDRNARRGCLGCSLERTCRLERTCDGAPAPLGFAGWSALGVAVALGLHRRSRSRSSRV